LINLFSDTYDRSCYPNSKKITPPLLFIGEGAGG
jgi:hypothetical protein